MKTANTLGLRFLKNAFSLYMIVLISTTIFQVRMEYLTTRENISKQINKISEVNNENLGYALWGFDIESIKRSTIEMHDFSMIAGVRIFETSEGRLIAESGDIISNIPEKNGINANR